MPSSDEREPQPWDDPEVMAADLKKAIRDIEESGGPGLLGELAENDTPTVHYVHDSDGAGGHS